MTNSMKAVTIPEFGPAEVRRLGSVAVQEPGPGEVSIDVAYAGANFAEVLYRQGVVDVLLPFVPGIEVSGRIRELGCKFTKPVVVPAGDEGAEVEVAGELTEVDGRRVVALTVTCNGEKVLGNPRAVLRA